MLTAKIYNVLLNPLFGLILALVLAAFAATGRISIFLCNILLTFAFLLGCFGIFRLDQQIHLQIILCLLLGILLTSISWGIQPKPPKFSILIESANIAIPPKPQNATSLALNVSIDNSGDPSIAVDWNLTVEIPGHMAQTARFMRLGQMDKLTWKGENTATIFGRDALEDKTENTPVIGKVRGQLWFILEGSSIKEVVNPKTILILSVKDKYRHLHSSTQTIDDISKR